ncbi:hypothetical protein D3C76_1392170 [compost metagenome]
MPTSLKRSIMSRGTWVRRSNSWRRRRTSSRTCSKSATVPQGASGAATAGFSMGVISIIVLGHAAWAAIGASVWSATEAQLLGRAARRLRKSPSPALVTSERRRAGTRV